MSSDNYIKIFKLGPLFRVEHRSASDHHIIDDLGEYANLEAAVQAANNFEKGCMEDGYGVEYGIDIDL